MKVVQFIADNAAAALAQIHDQLGPEAVVLSVRRLPGQGMARLWQRHGRIEVLASVPEPAAPDLKGRFFETAVTQNVPMPKGDGGSNPGGRWRSVAWLEAMGLMAEHADRLQAQLNGAHPAAPASLEAEWPLVQAALARFWPAKPSEQGRSERPHVFVGPPGSGKTTVLCKWLTLAMLTEERTAQVWRLDSHIANTAEFLTIHCEMLGVNVERFKSPPTVESDLYFIDLPGIETSDPQAMLALRSQLASLSAPHVHIVLNAAYETGSLLDQWGAFKALEPEDLILTHLDEEPRRVKLWNLVFGTNCCIRYLSAGQKIPGEFKVAAPELLLPAEFH